MTVHLFSKFKQLSMQISYSLLWLLLSPVLLVNLLFCLLIRKTGYTLARFSRFGICKKAQTSHNLLIHCASVGEVVAIQNLVEALQVKQPNLRIIISTNTTTGAERVKLLFAEKVSHYYLPYDFPLFVRVFLHNVKPNTVLINEMELWPNLCRQVSKLNIPLYMVNGRMSAKSTATYNKYPSLFQPMFQAFTHICAQGERDYENYLSLGIAQHSLTLTNNIKFEIRVSPQDLSLSEKIAQTFALSNRRILVAGSTHDPEEQILLDTYLELHTSYPDLLLIIVPRHPQRFEKVYQLLLKQKLNTQRMSEGQPGSEDCQVLLCDQMGKLRALYNLADIAFVGGSLAPRGGHNALEPAIFNVPIIMGPSIYNNPAIHNTLQDAGALKTVNNADEIQAACLHWLNNNEQRLQDGQSGGLVIQQNKGAIDKTLKAIGF